MIISHNTHAQTSKKEIPENRKANYTITVQPLYLFNGGLGLDIEKKIKHNKWIQLSISGYYLGERDSGYSWGTSNSDGDDFTALKGFGVGAGYKSFFNNSLFYYKAGMSYTYYNVSYLGGEFYPFEENGLTFWEFEYKTQKEQYNKLNGNICLGLQTAPVKGRFVLDFYAGVAYSYSFYGDKNAPFTEKVYEFGYRGFQPIGGIKLGMAF